MRQLERLRLHLGSCVNVIPHGEIQAGHINAENKSKPRLLSFHLLPFVCVINIHGVRKQTSEPPFHLTFGVP